MNIEVNVNEFKVLRNSGACNFSMDDFINIPRNVISFLLWRIFRFEESIKEVLDVAASLSRWLAKIYHRNDVY